MARYMYLECWSETVTAGHSKRVYSDRVPAGYVLHVMNCYAHVPERIQGDLVWIGVESGGKDCLVRSRGGDKAKEGMSALQPFLAGEGDRVFAYFPDADETDTVALHVNGFMIPTKEWRDLTE